IPPFGGAVKFTLRSPPFGWKPPPDWNPLRLPNPELDPPRSL
ncbi:unnamed protein product, partial [Rotaria magnacalcarata]